MTATSSAMDGYFCSMVNNGFPISISEKNKKLDWIVFGTIDTSQERWFMLQNHSIRNQRARVRSTETIHLCMISSPCSKALKFSQLAKLIEDLKNVCCSSFSCSTF